MLTPTCFYQFERMRRGSLRFRLFVLIFLSILPGTILLIHSSITQQHREVLAIFIIVISSIITFWFGGDFLISRSVKSLTELSKRLSSGDLTARASQADSSGLFGETAQTLDRIVTLLEENTEKQKYQNDKSEAFCESVNEFAIQNDISKLLQLIVDKVMMLLNVSYVAISLYDASRSELEFVAVNGFDVGTGTRIRLGEGAVGRAAETRQLVVVDQSGRWEGHLLEFETDKFTTVAQVPMLYRNELIGVLGVAETGAARKFDQSEIRLMQLSAGAAAGTIKNTRLSEETNRRLRELEVINAVSTTLRAAQTLDEMLPVLLEKTMNVVNAIMGGIWLYHAADNALRQAVSNGIPPLAIRFQPGEGIFGTVFSGGQPYFTPDWREDCLTTSSVRSQIPKGLSCAFIPIRTAQSTIGVLMVGFHSPHEFLDEQKHPLITIAEIAGNAIHRMTLHDQTARQLQQLSALHQIDLAITGSPDIDTMLQILLEQVVSQLRVDAAGVLVVNPKQTLEFAAGRGFTTDALHHTHLRFGKGFAGRAALDQRMIYIPNLETHHHADYLFPPSFKAEGFVSYLAIPLVTKGKVKGILEVFHRSLLKPDKEWFDFLKALSSQAAIMIGYAQLLDDLQRSNLELNLAYDSTLEGWSRALEVRDQETKGHSQRVAEMTLRLAKVMGLRERQLIHIRRGALLHDIGKLGIPDSILLKPGHLDKEERDIIEKHPTIAYEMLAPITYIHPALDIPYCHHEKWNGTGYPRGLKGEEIPLSARIFAVVDVWDALTSIRPYRKAWSEAETLAYIEQRAGEHFDPQVVDAFLSLKKEEKANESNTEQALERNPPGELVEQTLHLDK